MVSLASAQSRLQRDAEAAAAAEPAHGSKKAPPKLTDEEREALSHKVGKSTFHLLWKLTKKDIEATLRAVVDALLDEHAPPTPEEAAAAAAEMRAAGAGAAGGAVVPSGGTAAAGAGALPAAPPDVDLPPHVLARARALVELGQAFSEALTFSQFLNRAADRGPSRAEKAAAAVEQSLRSRGVDVDAVRKSAAETGEAARRSVAEAGSAMNRLFGFGKKGSKPPAPPAQGPPPKQRPAGAAAPAADPRGAMEAPQ